VNPVGEAVQGVLGWRDLMLLRGDWRSRFRLGPEGLATAVGVYVIVVVINLLVLLLGAQPEALAGVFVNLALNVLPVVGLVAAIACSVAVLQKTQHTFALLVPAVHGLALVLLLGVVLAFSGIPAGPALLALYGYMLYRLGRAAGGFSLALSIAFSALCVLVLVALPLTLYMVIAPGPGPI
jgi:hypothetical protein